MTEDLVEQHHSVASCACCSGCHYQWQQFLQQCKQAWRRHAYHRTMEQEQGLNEGASSENSSFLKATAVEVPWCAEQCGLAKPVGPFRHSRMRLA